MTEREKLVELLREVQYLGGLEYQIADNLIANGVTFAKDNDVPTNASRIRAMSDEELASFIVEWDCHQCSEHRRLDNEPLLRGERCDEQCEKHLIEWLRQPAEE